MAYEDNARDKSKKVPTHVEPDINSRVHFVGVNNFASFRFVFEEMPNWVVAPLDLGISDSKVKRTKFSSPVSIAS